MISVWPSLPASALLRPAAATLPYPLDGDAAVFSRARHALWHGVRALGLAGRTVLVPAYHHGSEIEALARAGAHLRFYDVDELLRPVVDDALADGAAALYLVHYLGYPQDVERWRGWCDERGLLLLEDAAQSWLTSAGRAGELAVWCLYKTVGVPDGAALRVAAPVPSPGLRRQPAAIARLLARPLRLRRRRPYDSAEDFALGDVDTPVARESLELLPRLVDGVAQARRAHTAMLGDALGEAALLPLDEDAVPFAFAVRTGEKKALLDRLAARRVAGLDFWREPHPSLPAQGFPVAAELRRTVVCLPVHQELMPDDLERVAAAAAAVPARRRGQLAVAVHDDLDGLRDEWAALAASSRSIFAQPEWHELWWRHFGGGRRLAVLACRARDGGLRSVLPLYLARERPLAVARVVGHDAGDELGPICRDEDRTAVAAALRVALRREFAGVVAQQVPAAAGWSALLGGRVLRREGSPTANLDGGWDGYLAARSANFRSQLRRAERKLAPTYRLTDGADALERDLDVLFDLHRRRWAGPETDFSRREAFHRDVARLALERGWLRLWVLEAGGAARAAWLGFRLRDVEAYYQAGRDPDWEAAKVGFVLLAHTIREAAADGMREYRFLRGGEAYKSRFASRDDGLETFVVGAAPVAALAGVAAASRRRLAAAKRSRSR